MKRNTRLTSAVFQLTPTRTRCDLIIIANDKKEKIASGLLSPFLAHLKTAQDQVSKGGYSIFLVPETKGDAVWFTKATLERFVRFVSTPEILERLYTIESEILQIEEAIAVQNSNNAGQNIHVEDHQRKPSGSCTGNKPMTPTNEEKAIVLYKPGEQLPEVNGSCSQEGNSKVELLKVLETRKTVLQKEQGMAFARAVAAGFDIDQIEPLLSFAECFQALRLMEACSRFIELWKSKHETGQWLDIEASEELSNCGAFSAMNSSSDVILSATPNKHNISNHELSSDGTGQSPQKNNIDNPVPNGQQAYLQGQFPHLFVPPWAMHAPPGAQPIFPAYPVQGMPYYHQGYRGNGQFFPPPHNPMEYSPPNFGHQPLDKRQSLDHGMDSNIGSETWELDRTRSLDDMDEGVSHGQKPRKRSGGSNKKQAGKVVIRNINYITKEKKSGSASNSDSDNDTDGETFQADGNHIKRSSNSKRSIDEASKFGKDTDDGHWQAFQNCLLRGNDEDSRAHEGMFTMEKDINTKRRTNTLNDDPLALGALNTGEIQDGRVKDVRRISAVQSRRLRGSGDDALLSRADNDIREDIDFGEINGRNVLSRTSQEDIMIGSQHKQLNYRNSSDSLALNGFEASANKTNREFSNGNADEAFIIPFRSTRMDQAGQADRTAIDIESEIPLAHQKLDSEGNVNRVSYEPDDLSLMPERGTEKRSPGYELSVDYEMQVFASQQKGVKDVTDVKGKLRKSDKDMSSKVTSGSSYKQRNGGPIRKGRSSKMTPLEDARGPIRKGRSSKMTPLEDARARAESLRSYKADLQKQKKEKEEAEARRLAALKLERQKRIAAKGSSTASKPATTSPQTKQVTAKLSPATNRGSKFTDAEPGSSSPLQRSKVRISINSSELIRPTKAGKLSEGSQMAGNRLTRSSSSLSETKKESNGVTPDSKTSMARIRRLSEPKIVGNASIGPIKARSAEAVSKRKASVGPERNKVTAMVHLDRSKGETLPELKIKTSKSNANASETKAVQKVNGKNPSTFNAVKESNFGIAHEVDLDENPIVEKTVVMLEYEKPSHTTLRSSGAKSEVGNDSRHRREKSNVISGLATTHGSMDGVGRDPNISQAQKQLDPIEVRTTYSVKDPPNNATAEKPYQAPYARVSSLEDPSTAQSEYSKAPIVRSELVPRVEETVNAHIPDVKSLKTDKHSPSTEKTHVKELSKGLRRLLKFGKKNQSSSVDPSVDSDCRSVVDGVEHDDNARSAASTSQGHMLKNLISQDVTPNAGDASQKTSRHFSLFSPFRSKTSEKKQAS